MKKMIAAAALGLMAAGLAPASVANDDAFGLSPAACEEAVEHYLSKRLADPRSARVYLSSDPYKVYISTSQSEATAWAVDIRVKSRLPSGSWSNYQPYTVIFQNGVAVALEDDLGTVTRV